MTRDNGAGLEAEHLENEATKIPDLIFAFPTFVDMSQQTLTHTEVSSNPKRALIWVRLIFGPLFNNHVSLIFNDIYYDFMAPTFAILIAG